MNKIIAFPGTDGQHDAPTENDIDIAQLPAIANSITITLIQQALDDACENKNWKETKRKIDIAVKRGHLRIVD